jgi:predicted RNA-binding protein with PUA-like domain
MAKQYWLMKTEPEEFGIDDLARVDVEAWTGVRNYQARNFMRDEMKVGDEILFYHSSTKPTGVAGLALVHSSPYPDPTQFNQKSKYFDSKAEKDNPRWILIDVKFKAKFKTFVSLEKIKSEKTLENMKLLQRGSRLSIMPVTKAEFEYISKLGLT